MREKGFSVKRLLVQAAVLAKPRWWAVGFLKKNEKRSPHLQHEKNRTGEYETVAVVAVESRSCEVTYCSSNNGFHFYRITTTDITNGSFLL